MHTTSGGVGAPDPVDVRQRVAASVRSLRSRGGWSLADLAGEAGIGKSTLHAIESGEANPGIETLWALARALNVPFGELLEPPSPTVRVVRRGQAPRVVGETSGIEAFLLASTGHAARVELYDLRLSPGPSPAAEPHPAGTTEHVLVLTGRLGVGPLDAGVELGPGDLATFPADRAHCYEALEEGTRVLLLVQYP